MKRNNGKGISEDSPLDEMWREINIILDPERHSQRAMKLRCDSGIIEEPLKVAQEFNAFFKKKIVDLAAKIEKDDTFDPLKKLKEKMSKRSEQNGQPLRFTLKTVQVSSVLKVLKSLKNKKSHGFDQVSAELLKMTAEIIAEPLTYIINTSILTGKVPDQWKKARVSPLLKKGDPTERSNYRPVALLCVAGMVLEKIIGQQVEEFFETNQLFGTFQFGFRKQKSTVSELISLFDQVMEAKDQGKEIALLLYDLSAAFDTVKGSLLIDKLRIYGFDENALKWMTSYMTGRQQAVCVNGETSSLINIDIGTPQGSRISPLLFCIIMADLSSHIENSTLSNFADDTQSLIIANNEQALAETVKKESDSVLSFFRGNNLVNNPDKACLFLNSGGRGKLETIQNIGGENVKSKESEKLLGVQVSSNLDWNTHIKKLCGSSNRDLDY